MFCCLFLKYAALLPANSRVTVVARATTISAVSVSSGESMIIDVSTVTTVATFDIIFGTL